jgi:fibronectin type 3 domain-containing protein
VTISLTGTGVTHQVNLSWVAPASSTDPVVGYNVYRAAGGTSSYQMLNSAVNAVTTYTDMAVQSGATYDYYVTSVDSAGNQSVPSNVTTVTIP